MKTIATANQNGRAGKATFKESKENLI